MYSVGICEEKEVVSSLNPPHNMLPVVFINEKLCMQ